MAAQLSGHIPDSDREILTGDVDYFLENITHVSDALSTQLSAIADYLCKIADPLNPPAVEDLSSQASSLQNLATIDLPQELQLANIALTNTLTTHLSTHLTLLTHAIHVLELTQHGSLSRHTRSSAELLHTRSSLLSLQAKLHTFTHPPPAEFMAALKEFRRQQGSGEKKLKDRESLARRELELYGKAGEKGMRDLARRKGVLLGEIERCEAEVGKLERGG